jgi:hypothetical protein
VERDDLPLPEASAADIDEAAHDRARLRKPVMNAAAVKSKRRALST